MEVELKFKVFVLFGFFLAANSQELKFKAIHEMRQQAAVSEPLTLLWGIADTTAYVGKLFSYVLPSDAFQGNIIHYKVSITSLWSGFFSFL